MNGIGRIDPKHKSFVRVKNIAQRTARSLLDKKVPTTIIPGVGLVADITTAAFIARVLYLGNGPINENLILKQINENEVYRPDRSIRNAMNDLTVYGIVEKVKKGYQLTSEMRELVTKFHNEIKQ